MPEVQGLEDESGGLDRDSHLRRRPRVLSLPSRVGFPVRWTFGGRGRDRPQTAPFLHDLRVPTHPPGPELGTEPRTAPLHKTLLRRRRSGGKVHAPTHPSQERSPQGPSPSSRSGNPVVAVVVAGLVPRLVVDLGPVAPRHPPWTRRLQSWTNTYYKLLSSHQCRLSSGNLKLRTRQVASQSRLTPGVLGI